MLSKTIVVLTIGFLGTLYTAKAQGQKAAELDGMIIKLDSLISVTRPQVGLPTHSVGLSEVQTLFDYQNYVKTQEEIPGSEVINAQQQSLMQDKGLSFEAGYLENLDQGVFGAEGIYYNRRYQVGLKWDLLNGGWLDHTVEAKALEREKNILKLDHKKNRYIQQHRELQTAVDAIFNRQQLNHLKNYKDALAVQQSLLRDLYFWGYKSWDEVLDVIRKEAYLATEYQFLSEQQQHVSTNTNYNLPVLELDIQQIELALQDTDQILIDSLRLENVRDQHQPWQDISLSANLRYNYYSDQSSHLLIEASGNREYFSVGLNLSVPFTVFKNESKRYEQAYRADFDFKREERNQELLSTLRTYYADYQQLLTAYSSRYYEHQLQTQELRNIEFKGQLNEPEYSPASILSRILNQFEIKYQLIESKRKLYSKLIQIQALVPELQLASYATPWQPANLIKEEKVGSDVYIWSHTFESYPNRVLLQYLIPRQYQTILLSPGNNNLQKAREFINKAETMGVNVHLMKGSNVLIKQHNWQHISELCDRAARFGASGIHLDVEPHTFGDWETQKEEYLEQYLEMIQFASKTAKNRNLQLSVSIPVFYDPIIEKLPALVDQLYVMAYGSDEIGTVARRIREEYQIFVEKGDRVTLVLRPEDFKTNLELQKFRKKKAQTLGSVNIGVHDLGAIMKSEE